MIEFGKDDKICPHEVSLNGWCVHCNEKSRGNIQLTLNMAGLMGYSKEDIKSIYDSLQGNEDEFILKLLKLGFGVIKDGHEYELNMRIKHI